jgi:FAD/FMN-containing dehydrogenase
MKIETKKIFKNSKIISSVVISVFALLVVVKGSEYAAAPTKDKNCDFIFPELSDQTKLTTLRLDSKPSAEIAFQQKGGLINDASCLNKTAVYGVAKITNADDVKNALLYARQNNLKVTSAGQRHSMGGQSFSKNGLVLDMRGLNQMSLDKANKIIKVQSGAKWAAVQEYLDKQGFAVKAMQSINIFTVGGTLSVNAHGIAHDPGQIAPTVKSLTIVTADGKTVIATPQKNAELFKHALGGYGLFGVIIDADLEVVPNEVYAWSATKMDYKDFPEYFQKNVDGNSNIGLTYGRISVSPSSYLTETIVHTFAKTNYKGDVPVLNLPHLTWFSRLVFNFSKTGSVGRWTRWVLERYAEPRIHDCVTRNEAMSPNEVCDVTRNQEMYDSMGYLKNKLADTDILQEYFIPHDKMSQFVDGLRNTVKNNGTNLLNVTIRIVHKDTITSLPYAKDDRFAFVLYFNQGFNQEDGKILQKTTTDLIDVATNLGGTFYLPYQLFYSPAQLRAAYPEVDSFFAAKKKYDPQLVFSNTWYEKYSQVK